LARIENTPVDASSSGIVLTDVDHPLGAGTAKIAPLEGTKVPLAILNAWKLERGRPFAFGGPRGPSGEPPGRPFRSDGSPISWLMGDLHRRELPPIATREDVARLIESIGIAPHGALAERIARYGEHHSMSSLTFQPNPVPGPMITRYLLADLLAEGTD